MGNTVEQGLDYANKIVSNDIVSNRHIKLACEKFLAEIDDNTKPYYFDRNKAGKVLRFFNACIKHVKGHMAGKPYILSPWEVWILINLFGFIDKKDNTRRFKNAIVFVARKNSKSTLSAGIALYHLIADGTQGAEAYSVATQRDQAKIVWDTAKAMINKMNLELRQFFAQTISHIRVDRTNSIYRPLGRDSKGLDGLNVSMAIFDESSAITDRNIHEVITSSQGARKEYLNLHITTAQFDKETVFYENYDYVKKILEGDVTDDRWFGAIYELEVDKGDRWDDPSVWIKANPNLGASVNTDFLISEMKQASQIKSKRNNFLVKHLNVWTTSAENWLPVEDWQSCIVDKIERDGNLWVGVDLGATNDLTSLGFLYRNKDRNKYYFEAKCFMPENVYEELPKRHKEIYKKGLSEGVLMLTEGNATNFRTIKEFLIDFCRDKDLKEIAFDPWSARTFSTELLEDGYNAIEVRQNLANLSPATKDTEVHIRKGEILHEDSKFIEWQFNNCTIYTDVNGNIKVRKGDDRTLKIDSIIAMILAMSRASANGGLETMPKFTMNLY